MPTIRGKKTTVKMPRGRKASKASAKKQTSVYKKSTKKALKAKKR